VFKVLLLNDGYVYNSAHVSLDDVDVGFWFTDPVELANCTFTGGVLDADDVEYTDLQIGETITSVLVYLEDVSGTALIVHLDESVDGSIPHEIQFASGAIQWPTSGIFRL